VAYVGIFLGIENTSEFSTHFAFLISRSPNKPISEIPLGDPK